MTLVIRHRVDAAVSIAVAVLTMPVEDVEAKW